MISEVVILAGGLGTRLKSVVSDLPKSLAPVSGKPFLAYLLDYAKSQGIKKYIFALGYKTEQIEDFIRTFLPEGSYQFSVEENPLGTGGAIYKACQLASSENVIVLNADTYYAVSFSELEEEQERSHADCTLALKPMQKFDRYGVVKIDHENIITGFQEKSYQETGLINGGVYAIRVRPFLQKNFPGVFSFEKDYLELYYAGKKISGIVSSAYFIDIGIPEDFKKAQTELPDQIKKY